MYKEARIEPEDASGREVDMNFGRLMIKAESYALDVALGRGEVVVGRSTRQASR